MGMTVDAVKPTERWPGEPRRPKPLRGTPRWWWYFIHLGLLGKCDLAYFATHPERRRGWAIAAWTWVAAIVMSPLLISALQNTPQGFGAIILVIWGGWCPYWIAAMAWRARRGAKYYDAIETAKWVQKHKEWEVRVAALKEAQDYAGRLPG